MGAHHSHVIPLDESRQPPSPTATRKPVRKSNAHAHSAHLSPPVSPRGTRKPATPTNRRLIGAWSFEDSGSSAGRVHVSGWMHRQDPNGTGAESTTPSSESESVGDPEIELELTGGRVSPVRDFRAPRSATSEALAARGLRSAGHHAAISPRNSRDLHPGEGRPRFARTPRHSHPGYGDGLPAAAPRPDEQPVHNNHSHLLVPTPLPEAGLGGGRSPQEVEQPLVAASADNAELLRDRMGLLSMQIGGLEELNRQSLSRIASIHTPNHMPTEAEQEEVATLVREVGVRRRHVMSMQGMLEAVQDELFARGLPFVAPQPPSPESGLDADDGLLCQFCLTNPVTVEYKCCNYRAACMDCAVTMQRITPRCPHCRAYVPPADDWEMRSAAV